MSSLRGCLALPGGAARRRRRQGSALGSPHVTRAGAIPPTIDEIVAVMRQAGHDRHGHRLSALTVVLWRAGLRINEALSLTETDLDQRRGSILVRHGKDDRPREVGMDAWACARVAPGRDPVAEAMLRT